MAFPTLLLIALSMPPGPSTGAAGAIRGLVVNGSRGRAAAAGTEVVLRANVDGKFIIAAETVADREGRFVFEPLPIDSDFQYLPGANRGGVHYPGRRIRLTAERPEADVELVVHDAVAAPSPLVARRHEIVVRPEVGALSVTETILVDNPTATCYVGRPDAEGAEPVTLRLAVPPDFDRTTFHEEFYGRRFSLIDGRLVTGIPWPPGRRELTFTYLVRNQEAHRLWRRPLDLPCSQVTLRVLTDKPEDVSSNVEVVRGAPDGEVVFASTGRVLPAGYVLRLELGHLPVPWMAYGKWLAAAALLGSIAAAGLAMTRTRGRPASGKLAASEEKATGASKPGLRGPGRDVRRGPKPTASGRATGRGRRGRARRV